MPTSAQLALTSVLALCGGVLGAYAIRTAVAGRTGEARVRDLGTPLLNVWLVEAFYWAFRGVSALLLRTPVTPDQLTLGSLVLVLVTTPLAATGQLGWAGVLLIVASAFDAFDGIVARHRKLSSDAGEMLDAVVDRYADAAPLVGLAIYYRHSAWLMSVPLAALVGSAAISYVRAKSEALRLSLPSGLMRRHERLTYLIGALVVGPLLPSPAGVPATIVVVAVVAAVSNYAAASLTVAARVALRAEGRGPGGAS